jgi:hypothetical protein
MTVQEYLEAVRNGTLPQNVDIRILDAPGRAEFGVVVGDARPSRLALEVLVGTGLVLLCAGGALVLRTIKTQAQK